MNDLLNLGRPTRPFVLVLCLMGLGFVGCGDATDDGSNTGGSAGSDGGFASCSICVGSMPIGPNESDETCTAFGALFGCETSTLQGECPDQGACVVTNCTSDPDCNAELP
jgi:hypothetical protein